MTEKRFKLTHLNHIDAKELENLLNDLSDENEQLRMKNNAYIQDIEVYKEENTHLKLENEQLKELLECSREEANDYCEELMGKDEFVRLFKEENEQFKQFINNLKETIIKITIAYQRKYNSTIVDLVDEVHDEDIADLIKELQE